MPFTQDRAIALITAGLNYKYAYEYMHNRARLLQVTFHGEQDPEKRQIAIVQFFIDVLPPLETAMQDSVALLTEHAHFARLSKDNLKRAEKQRLRRAHRASERMGLTIDPITGIATYPMPQAKPLVVPTLPTLPAPSAPTPDTYLTDRAQYEEFIKSGEDPAAGIPKYSERPKDLASEMDEIERLFISNPKKPMIDRDT
jgi:hypothetical protein